MNIMELIVKASYQIWMVVPSTIEPTSFGSGCIVNYQDRSFLLTVAHVTDKDKAACIVTNQPPEGGLASKLYSVGPLCYFDEYTLPENIHEMEVQNFEELQAQSSGGRLDIAFCELKEKVKCIQPELDFGEFNIHRGCKVHLNLDLAGDPDESKRYGFFGTVRHQNTGAAIRCEPTFKCDLRYEGTYREYHLFRAPEIIKDADDYRGCSGAPILEDTGKLVGLLSSVNVNSTMINVFPISKCKELLDLSFTSDLL